MKKKRATKNVALSGFTKIALEHTNVFRRDALMDFVLVINRLARLSFAAGTIAAMRPLRRVFDIKTIEREQRRRRRKGKKSKR